MVLVRALEIPSLLVVTTHRQPLLRPTTFGLLSQQHPELESYDLRLPSFSHCSVDFSCSRPTVSLRAAGHLPLFFVRRYPDYGNSEIQGNRWLKFHPRKIVRHHCGGCRVCCVGGLFESPAEPPPVGAPVELFAANPVSPSMSC